MRQVLDHIWDWLSGRGSVPAGLADKCEGMILTEIFDEEDDMAFRVTTSLFGLAKAVEGRTTDGVSQCAQINIDMIDAFLYYMLGLDVVSDKNDNLVDCDDLMRSEISRQLDDIGTLSGADALALIPQLRLQWRDVSLFSGYWFGAAGNTG